HVVIVPAPLSCSPLSLHDALPIWLERTCALRWVGAAASCAPCACNEIAPAGSGRRLRRRTVRFATAQHRQPFVGARYSVRGGLRSEEHTSELQSRENLVCRLLLEK